MPILINTNRLFWSKLAVDYPGYQRFFLACDGELRFVGRKPTRVRPKAEDTSGEAARKNFSRGSPFKT